MNWSYKTGMNKKILIIVFLTLLTASLRLPTLGSPLDIDEGISFHDFSFSPWGKLLLEYKDGNQHTLFSVLSRISMGLFGVNEISFRLPVFFAGVFAVPLLYMVSLSLLGSEIAAGFSCLLLAFSIPHLGYSQDGRGYSLSVFFALVIAFAVLKLLKRKNILFWGSLLTLSGFCMVITLPSNIFFLPAIFLFYVLTIWNEIGEAKKFFNKKLVVSLVPFLILICMAMGYFYVIYPGLKQNVGYYGQEIALNKFLDVFKFLVSPWGFWIFLVLVFGILSLISKKMILPFFFLFLTPVALILASGFMGPPRVYIYLLPFVLLIIAQGFARLISGISLGSTNKTQYILIAGICICISIQPVLNLVKYYPTRYERKISTINSALKVSHYVAENFPSNTLIVIPYRDKTLLHYLEDRIINDMIDIVFEGKINKMVFIGNQHIQPQNFPLKPYYPGHSILLNERLFKLNKEIGNTRVYDFGAKISSFIPSEFDPDYEGKLNLHKNRDITIGNTKDSKMAGSQALFIKNRAKSEILIGSKDIKLVDIKTDNAYLLFAYARGYPQGSKALLYSLNDEWPPAISYLNEHQKVHKFGSDLYWQLVFLISPLRRGQQSFQEVIHLLGEETSYFDVFQSYILQK